MTQNPPRQPAAIMFTDIVGYSALMQRDEEAARIARGRHRSALGRAVEPHGKILQYFGDGSLSVFGGSVAAVRAAVSIQKDLREDPAVPLRIGIHFGSIAYDEQGAYGDAVNVAARIENLCVGGGVLISELVRDQIADEDDLPTKRMGQVGLKHILEPITLYAVSVDGLALPDARELLQRARGGARADVPVFPSAQDFEIVRLIGEGAKGRVYLARELVLDRLVAIKMLRPELFSDDVARKRFEREARSIARLSHPHVSALYRVGETEENVPYLVMEYVPGRNLAEILETTGPFPTAEALRILAQLSSALNAAHGAGIIHRDVKAANVVWDTDAGRAVLMDFGIAAAVEGASADQVRLTTTGQILGDPDSMSPEQLLGEPLTAATDIYSLGVLGYRLLTHEGPYPDSATVDLALAHLQTPARRIEELAPGTDPELSTLLQRCLAKDPNDRPKAVRLASAFDTLERRAVRADGGRHW
jgi:class 3 adenylate cyclase/tRNA A-37 threonylcarbamoyl transferase component Bud32